jgi:hypothetical protein
MAFPLCRCIAFASASPTQSAVAITKLQHCRVQVTVLFAVSVLHISLSSLYLHKTTRFHNSSHFRHTKHPFLHHAVDFSLQEAESLCPSVYCFVFTCHSIKTNISERMWTWDKVCHCKLTEGIIYRNYSTASPWWSYRWFWKPIVPIISLQFSQSLLNLWVKCIRGM